MVFGDTWPAEVEDALAWRTPWGCTEYWPGECGCWGNVSAGEDLLVFVSN